MRLLLNTKLGETMLRPLLRTEIGEVANRRAWFDRSKLNGETLRLYRLPLCIEGWDGALMEAARTRQKMTQRDVAVALEALKDTPTLMVTGADDVVAPPTRAIAVAAEPGGARSRSCRGAGTCRTRSRRARCSKRCGRSCSRRCSGGGGGNH